MTREEIQRILAGVGQFTNQYGDILAGIGGAAATEKGISDIRGTQTGLMKGLTGSSTLEGAFPKGLINSVTEGMKFKPFTVTSGTGATAAADTSGGLDLNLSPTEQALQTQLLGLSKTLGEGIGYGRQKTLMDLLRGSPKDQQTRETDIFNRLNAMQLPEQERARLELEQRLFNQGRLGVQTSMFGGTPEALALEKAIAEQQAGTAVSAMDQARAEQAQYSNQTLAALETQLREQGLMAQSIPEFLKAAYTPQAGLIGALSPSVDLSRIQSALQAGGTEAVSNLGIQGLTTQTNLESFINAQRQQQLQGLFDLLAAGQTGGTKTNQNTFSIPYTLAELFGPRN